MLRLGDPLEIFHRVNLSEQDNKLYEKIQTAISNFQKSLESSDKKLQRDTKEKLGNAYWELLIYIVLTRVEQNMPTLKFTIAEEYLINFGLLDIDFLPHNSKLLQTIERENNYVPLVGPFRMYRLTDWLVERYHTFYKKVGGPISGKLLFQNESVKLKMELDSLKSKRKNIVSKLLLRSALLNGIKSFLLEYDDFRERELHIVLKPRLTVMDEREIKGMSDNRKRVKDKYDGFLQNIEKTDEDLYDDFVDIQRKIAAKLSDYVEVLIEVEIYGHHDLVEMGLATRIRKNPMSPKVRIESELLELRSSVNGAAKKARVDVCPVLLNEKQIITKKDAVDLLNRVRMVDTNAFRTSLARRIGKPGILFVPGNGNGMFHYENNVFLLPLAPPKTATYSILSSVVQYRWENDEDRTMRAGYQDLKPYRRLNILDLRKAMLNDYVLWVSREALGYKVLDKLVRPWFQQNIKVNKEAVEELKEAISPTKKKEISKSEKEQQRQREEEEENQRKQKELQLKMKKEAVLRKTKQLIYDVINKKFPDNPDIEKHILFHGNGDKTITIDLEKIEYLDFGDLLAVLLKLYNKGYFDAVFRFE